MTQHNPWKKSVLRLLVVATVAAVAVSASAGFALAVPNPPHEVFGTVEDQDGDVMAGLTVEVVHDGTVINSTTTDSDGYYEIKISDDSLEKGDQLTIQVKDRSDTTSYSSGSSERIDFTVERATTTTTTSDDDNTGGGNTGGGNTGGQTGGQTGGGDDTTSSDDDTSEMTSTTETTKKGVQDTSTSVTETGEPPADDDTTESDSDGTDSDETETTTTTDDGGLFGNIPGFGVTATIVALVAAALLAVRRND